MPLSITNSTVRLITSASVQTMQAGEAIPAGSAFYIDSSNKAMAVDASDSTKVKVAGIVLTPSSADGDYISFVKNGDLYLGSSVVTQGTVYYANSSGVAEVYGSLSSNDYLVQMFQAIDSDTVRVNVVDTQIQKP